jgi:hypothetical protein
LRESTLGVRERAHCFVGGSESGVFLVRSGGRGRGRGGIERRSRGGVEALTECGIRVE